MFIRTLISSLPKCLAAAALCLAAGACAQPARDAGRAAFWRHDYPAAQKLFEQNTDTLDKDFVLYNLETGSAAFDGGNYYTARIALERAAQAMRGQGGANRGLASLIANESIKMFKGDPFEQAMANFYDGLIYYRWADYYNARAAFHQALMADMSSEEKHRDDFAVAHFMIAKCYQKIDDPDNARIHFERAREKYPDNPCFSDDAINDHNVLIVLQLGKAPVKVQSGVAGSIDEYNGGYYREDSASVSANGKPLGASSLAVDLLEQARTSGRSAKDTIQAAKGVVKTGLITAGAMGTSNDSGAIGPALLIAGLLFPAGADVRQWDLLPGEIHLLSAKLEPGVYTFTIDFLDNSSPIAEMRQVWYHVPVEDGCDTLLVFRSGYQKSNGNYPPPVSPVFQETGATVAATDAPETGPTKE